MARVIIVHDKHIEGLFNCVPVVSEYVISDDQVPDLQSDIESLIPEPRKIQ